MVPHRFQKGNCGSNLGLKSNPCFTKAWDNTNFESTTWCQTPRCEAIPSKQTRIVCIIKGNHPVQNSLSCASQTQQHPKGKQQKKNLIRFCCMCVAQSQCKKRWHAVSMIFGDWHGLASLSRSWRSWHFEPTILDLTAQRSILIFPSDVFPNVSVVWVRGSHILDLFGGHLSHFLNVCFRHTCRAIQLDLRPRF